MARTLTPKRKGFVKDYLQTGNATLAARQNFNVSNDNSAAAIGSELLRLPKIREYIENKANRAAEIIYELAETAETENVKLGAAKDILDRAGLKPIEKTANLNVNVQAEVGDIDLDLLVQEAENKLKEQKLNG